MTPEGWLVAPVEQLFELQLGKMLNKEATRTNPTFPYLGNREVQWGRFDLSDLRRMHFSEDEQTKFSLRHGDLLVCEGGEVGRTALWRGNFECYFQKALHRLRPLNSRATSEFMLHFMRFAADSGRLANFTSQSSIAHLTRERLAQVEVLLPPLPEQRKIAAILSSVDDAIEASQTVIYQLQVVKKAMMAELLTKGLPGGHKKFKQTEIGVLPEEWEVAKLGSLADIAYGLTVNGQRRKSAKRLPYLTVANLQDEQFDLVEVKQIGVLDGDEERYAVRQGDVLLVEGNANIARLGRAAIWTGQLPLALHQNHLIRVRVGQAALTPAWVHLVLGACAVREQIESHAKTSSGLNTINSTVVAGLTVAVPSPEEQAAICNVREILQARLTTESMSVSALRAVRSALMSVLLTGEVRVRVDEGGAA